MLRADINKSHVTIITSLHIDIIHLACVCVCGGGGRKIGSQKGEKKEMFYIT